MFSNIARINLTIVASCIASLLFANAIGIIPDTRELALESRVKLCESLATTISFLVSEHEYGQIETHLGQFAKHNPDCISAGVQRADGLFVASTSAHASKWNLAVSQKSDGCFEVPIVAGESNWGKLQIQFEPLYAGIQAVLSLQVVCLLLVVVPLIGFASWLHLKRVLKYLDPKESVPPRVRQTLDSFAEGVVLIDIEERIVLANASFADLLSTHVDLLIGRRLSQLPWSERDKPKSELPWLKACRTRSTVNGATLSVVVDNSESKSFSVNSSPVLDEKGEIRGVMIAFADVTALEQKRAQLAKTLSQLHESKEEICRQNEELRYLATRDPLTSCINRRTFFEQFERFFAQARDSGHELSVMMVDIDFFKSINDNYGHSIGDLVLRKTGALLNELARKEDVVCRYGGEEFSILMPGLSLDASAEFAEKIRRELSNLEFDEFTITASLGLSDYRDGARDPQEILDEADKCLYVAKRNGRNQVVRFDKVPEDLVVDESKISRTKQENLQESNSNSVPFSAVTALLSALTYRDVQTGAHSTRVAAYASLLAQQYLGARDVYIVEIAGLLHDIGKIGVPDAILLKPGDLSKEEWSIMERHDRIGVEIVNKAFKHDGLTDIVRLHHARFDGTGVEPVGGRDIPVGARILTIADSFDAMVSDRPYRRGMSIEFALAELRRCSGTQFDPELVEAFCKMIDAGTVRHGIAINGLSQEVMLSLGEQIERIVEAADAGNQELFLALTGRLQQTAERANLGEVAELAARAMKVASEEDQLQEIERECFELLEVFRAMHAKVVMDAEQSHRPLSSQS